MFFGGLAAQTILPQIFKYPQILKICFGDYISWWANVVWFWIIVRMIAYRKSGAFNIFCDVFLALFSLTIRRFGLPDDDDMPVVGYGAGYWLWLTTMALPLVNIGVMRWRQDVGRGKTVRK
jgi:hypothetical protein